MRRPRPSPAPPAPPPVTVPTAPPPPPPSSGDPKFDAFLAEARKTALDPGITAETFDAATAGIAPIPSIAAMNANQPEFSKPVWSYLDQAVSARRIADAKVMLARYGDVLAKIEASSGVPKEILVAIWGMESDFGADSGSFNLFAALATLAYDGPRADYARPEFFAALKLYQEQHYPLSEMVASWAGAFGQTQFTPTTFFKYAADGDGDGKIDLWTSAPDALASAARLLADQGWKKGEPWGYEVKLPPNFPYEDADTDTQKTVAEWRAMGVKTADGALLPQSDDSAGIYLPAGARGPAFLVLLQFQRDPQIQQCRELCAGCGSAGRSHGGRRAGADIPGRATNDRCHAPSACSSKAISQNSVSIPARRTGSWGARPAPR